MNPDKNASALSRRSLLKAGAIASAAAAVPAGAAALRGKAAVLVYDSRLPESLAFARTAAAVTAIDLAAEHGARFATLRAPLPTGHAVEGLTRHSDWTALRRELARQGLRVTAEATSAAGLVRWTLRPRNSSQA